MNYKVSLGVDVGAMTTKIAAIVDGYVLDTVYLKNKPGLGKVSKCNTYSCNICNDGCSTGFILSNVDEFVKSLKENYSGLEIDASMITGSQMRNKRILREMNERFPTAYITEITAHANGVEFLYNNKNLESAIIDIGGQDSKVIITDAVKIDYNGKSRNGIRVRDSAMNTICAAGTGAYFEALSEDLGIEIEKFGELALEGFKKVKDDLISARCATFARGMFARHQQDYTKEELAAAACNAQAESIMGLANKKLEKYSRDKIIFQGGVASNKGMVHALHEVFKKKIIVPEHERISETNKVMGALGAAHLAEKYKEPIRKNYGYIEVEERPKHVAVRTGGSK